MLLPQTSAWNSRLLYMTRAAIGGFWFYSGIWVPVAHLLQAQGSIFFPWHWKSTSRCRSLCPVPGHPWANHTASVPLALSPFFLLALGNFSWGLTINIVNILNKHTFIFYHLPNTALLLRLQRPLSSGSSRGQRQHFSKDNAIQTGCEGHALDEWPRHVAPPGCTRETDSFCKIRLTEMKKAFCRKLKYN